MVEQAIVEGWSALSSALGGTTTAMLGLTPIQAGMVYESAVADQPWVNLEQVVCRFDDEALDITALAAAWHHAQGRHAMLRASIATGADDQLVQLLHAEAPLSIGHEDWSGVPAGEREDTLRRWLAADRDAGIDLTAPPAMRVWVLELGPRSWVLVWTFPHALLDGRSFGTVIEEVLDAYHRTLVGLAPADLPEPALFAEHVAAVAALDPVPAEAHFRALLDGFGEPTPPPGGDPAVHAGVGRHDERSMVLGSDDVRGVDAWAANLGVTFGAVLLSVWGVLLTRYTGRHDVVFGCTRAGRHLTSQTASMVGCLINTVPVRMRALPGRTVGELVRDVRAQQLSVRPFEHTSLVDIERWAGAGPDAPLIQSLVVYERRLLDSHLRAKGGPWAHRHVEVLEETAGPMAVVAHRDEVAGEVHLRVEYDRDRWDAASVDRILTHLARLLAAVAHVDPDTAADDLPMLSEAELRRLLVECNPAPTQPPPRHRTLADVFEAQAAASGDALAVRALPGGEELTFAELDAAANRLARHLQAVGVGPEVVVGVCLPRSVDLVVGLLGVAKAGGVYLPLDPSHPAPAIHHMLTDARATVVVTEEASRDLLDTDAVSCVSIDGDAARLALHPPTAPERPQLDADATAYVIYTSGSSGPAKGVAVSHGALLAYADAIVESYDLDACDRALQFASLSFDVSIEELVPTLLAGAAVVLRSDEMAESIPALLDAVDREHLTVLNLPTAFWHSLVEHLDASGDRLSPSVRLVIAGGEKVSRSVYERWLQLQPAVAWRNGYGPTETTVTCTVFEPSDHPLPRGVDVPIGRPLANARAYVLGGDGRWLAPPGAVGELWIGGSSVAAGYLGRPDLTAERFRPDPWSPDPDARMYRTGDLARWLPSRDLEFRGRADRQVKRRGHRIEPGEVEAALERLPEVHQAFVAVRPGPAGDRLVAWVVAAHPHGFDPTRALAALRSQLPSHLVPDAAVAVTAIPFTPNGKVDLAALPSPSVPTAVPPARGDVDADDPGLRAVCELFGQLLGLGGPAAADLSFLDAGGHSLLAVRLLSRVERQLGRRVSLAALHRDPTPRGVHAAIAAGSEPERPTYLVSIQPSGDRPPLYGVHVLGANACYYRPLAAHLGPDQPVLGLSVDGPGSDRPTAVDELARLYADEIDRHRPHGPVSLAAVSMGSYVAFELAHELRRRGREVGVLVLLDAAGPGGRPQVDRAHRLRIHVAQLRRHRLRYLRDRVARWVEVVRDHRRTLRLRRVGSPAAASDHDLWLHSFVLANVRAAGEYRAQPYAGNLAVIRAAGELFDDPVCVDTGLGWRPVAAGGLRVVEVPGRHMTMLQEPHVGALAVAVAGLLLGPEVPSPPAAPW